MKQRCPSSKFIKRVYLESHKFVYDGYSSTRKGAVANVIEQKDGVVLGVLFEINEDNLAALDCYEGYPSSYNRKFVIVKDEEENNIEVVVYYRIGESIGKPSHEYRQIVIDGARDCNLPEEYIKNNLEGFQNKSRF